MTELYLKQWGEGTRLCTSTGFLPLRAPGWQPHLTSAAAGSWLQPPILAPMHGLPHSCPVVPTDRCGYILAPEDSESCTLSWPWLIEHRCMLGLVLDQRGPCGAQAHPVFLPLHFSACCEGLAPSTVCPCT